MLDYIIKSVININQPSISPRVVTVACADINISLDAR